MRNFPSFQNWKQQTVMLLINLVPKTAVISSSHAFTPADGVKPIPTLLQVAPVLKAKKDVTLKEVANTKVSVASDDETVSTMSTVTAESADTTVKAPVIVHPIAAEAESMKATLLPAGRKRVDAAVLQASVAKVVAVTAQKRKCLASTGDLLKTITPNEKPEEEQQNEPEEEQQEEPKTKKQKTTKSTTKKTTTKSTKIPPKKTPKNVKSKAKEKSTNVLKANVVDNTVYDCVAHKTRAVDFQFMDGKNLRYYCQDGYYLSSASCKGDCKRSFADVVGANGSVFYCILCYNYGILDEEDKAKAKANTTEHYALCSSCYAQKEGGGRSRRHCR